MEKFMELREAKQGIRKIASQVASRENNVEVHVCIYDCDELGYKTYDIEIQCLADGEYKDCVVTDRGEEGELTQVKKRARAVLKSVKGWFEYTDIKVKEKPYVYTNGAGSEEEF